MSGGFVGEDDRMFYRGNVLREYAPVVLRCGLRVVLVTSSYVHQASYPVSAGSRTTGQCSVPFEAARNVAYSYVRPRALYRFPFCGLIPVYTDLDTTGHGRLKTKSPTAHCVCTRF